MSTTTIRLGDLKERVAAAAERAGKSMHAYIVDAIRESLVRDEQRADFVGVALARRAKYEETGRAVSFEDMQAYALKSARGEKPPKPVGSRRAVRGSNSR
jgi:predicted transcriptional regulator